MNCGTGNNIWIIIIILFCCCGNNGFGNFFGGCGCNGNSENSWIIILIVIFFCCCGNNGFGGICDSKC